MSSVLSQTLSQLGGGRTGKRSTEGTGLTLYLTKDWARAAKAADDLLRSNPWRALGGIALLGVATGFLVTRSSRQTHRGAADEVGAELSEMAGG